MKACALVLFLAAALPAFAQTILIPAAATWKYLDNGTDQGDAWTAEGFVDSSWPSGTAELGYGDSDEATTVGYGGNPNNRYITTYFRRTFNISDRSLFTNLLVRLRRDDGAVVYLNGSEVFRSNMPNGPVNYRTAASSAASDDGDMFQSKRINPSLLRDGSNTVAVEIHQNTNTSSDISFDLELVGNAAIMPPTVSMARWPTHNGGNGHFYEAMASGGIAWNNASLAATNRGGYMATVTSAEEHQLIFNLVRANTNLWVRRPSGDVWGPWLGAVQASGAVEPSGGWTWVTGESFSFENWGSGEPNNNLGVEDRIHFLGEQNLIGDRWNDSVDSNGAIRGFVIEYDHNLEPAPLVELLFNEQGTNVINTGRESAAAVLFNASDLATDLHSDTGLGVSGEASDRAFDNSVSTGMGSGGSGGRATQPYNDSVDGLMSLTLQGWFKTDTTVGSNARLFAKQGSGTGFLFLVPSSGRLSLEINGASSTMSSAQFSEVGQWVFFAVTYDGSASVNNVKFYKGTLTNGVTLVETRTLDAGPAAGNSSGVSFGNANGLQRPLDGFLDNFRIFGSKSNNRGALTQAQLEWFRNKDVQNEFQPVPMTVKRSSAQVVLSWPVYSGGFRVESTSALSDPVSWEPVLTAPTIINEQNVLTLPAKNAFTVFRLRR